MAPDIDERALFAVTSPDAAAIADIVSSFAVRRTVFDTLSASAPKVRR